MGLIHTWYNDRYCCTLPVDTSFIDLDLDSRSQECEKAETSAQIISQSCHLVGMKYGILLRLVGSP